MSSHELAVVVLAAGKGTRMRSAHPKVLHPIAGRPMVHAVLSAAQPLEAGRTVVVVGPDMDELRRAVAPLPCVVQRDQAGTGDAVRAVREVLAGFEGDLLVLYGDTPLLRAATLQALVEARHAQPGPGLVLLGFRPDDSTGYGRIVLDGEARPVRIVEERDAGDAERAIGLCNGGVMIAHAATLFGLLERVGRDNAKAEYYLTDVVALAAADGLARGLVEAAAEEVLGVNSRAELAVAEAVLQQRLRAAAMVGGATLIDPTTVWFAQDTQVGRDVLIEPNVVFGPEVRLGDGVTVKAFSHVEGADIRDGATVGPFARLRPGTVVGEGARIGNFVEAKNSRLGSGAKANHLAYLGDTAVGAGANIGAGTITANYDGVRKNRTEIGARAQIGSNAVLVAPVKVGDGAVVGAGSVITDDVEADALALARPRQTTIPGGGARTRERAVNRTLEEDD
jgi:bifunctional UDP-N-acetylglucosamine pyrophosphorylase/glucosamine-1-phosphate N-acetyltransferase